MGEETERLKKEYEEKQRRKKEKKEKAKNKDKDKDKDKDDDKDKKEEDDGDDDKDAKHVSLKPILPPTLVPVARIGTDFLKPKDEAQTPPAEEEPRVFELKG